MTDVTQHEQVWDDFRNGFDSTGPGSRWFHTTAGPHVADDGVVTTSADGLQVVSGGRHPGTAEPAFTRTVPPEPADGAGLPGVLDHVKWLVYAQHQASTGLPGFDATPGRVLSCSATFGGRTYGTGGHPFGAEVADPDDDLRLATAAINAFDAETYVVFDFFLTNKRVYAFYERLPFARDTLGDYAAFSYGVPVADRTPDDEHRVEIGYDRLAGTAHWLLDGREVFRVDRIGHHLPGRRHLVLDHGGTETTAQPRQLNFGMGLLSLLDGTAPGHSPHGLARLSGVPGFYLDPISGGPQKFADEHSHAESRLFGQGAELRVRRFTITEATPR
ncbi:DUF6081 family protein [Micromonospora sp. NPDC049101]|uniref:DUF6081 family protein n=1 Tax=Micromonospora sp. NPDC049101 TaxID=3155032 RepID=UPI0033F2E6AB